MKKEYNQPTIKVVEIRPIQMITASEVHEVNSNNNIRGGGSDKDVQDVVLRGRQARFSADEWEE